MQGFDDSEAPGRFAYVAEKTLVDEGFIGLRCASLVVR